MMILLPSFPARDEASIDANDLASDERGAVRSEEGNQLGHLFRCPKRPIGCARFQEAISWSGFGCSRNTFSFSGVMIVPGATALTRMPTGARSMAACCVKALIPPFA